VLNILPDNTFILQWTPMCNTTHTQCSLLLSGHELQQLITYIIHTLYIGLLQDQQVLQETEKRLAPWNIDGSSKHNIIIIINICSYWHVKSSTLCMVLHLLRIKFVRPSVHDFWDVSWLSISCHLDLLTF